MNFLAVDLGQLACHVASHLGLDPEAERLTDTLAMLDALKPMKRHLHLARALSDLTVDHPERGIVAHRLATHARDIS